MGAPTQVLPPWLSASTSYITTDHTVLPTTVVVNLPLTYYGPSIPLGTGWVYGGSTSPPPTSATPTASPASLLSTVPSTTGATRPVRPSRTPTRTSRTDRATATPSRTESSSTGTLPSSGTSASPSSTPSTSSALSIASTSSVTGTATASTGTASASSSIAIPSSSLPFSTTPSSTVLWPPSSEPTGSLQPISGAVEGLSHGAVIAIAVVCTIVPLLLLACCIFLLIHHRRRRRYNSGRHLEGDTSLLPPGPDERGERGGLLEGRQDGGESPRSPEMDELSHLPIANAFMSGRRRGDGDRGSYQAVGTGAAAGAVAGAALAAAGHTHSSRSGHGSDETQNTSSHDPSNQASSGYHEIPPSLNEDAELMTAQRATRSPLARLARFSWLTRNRDTLGTSMAATVGSSRTDDQLRDPGRNERRPSRRHSASTALLSPPPPARFSLPVGTRGFGSAAALLPSPPTSPPPTSLMPPPINEDISRRPSHRTAQSGMTTYYDASSRPHSSHELEPPPPVGTAYETGSGSENDSPPMPTSADFPAPPGSANIVWPRFNNGAEFSPTTFDGSAHSDPLDLPAPARYNRLSAPSTGQVGLGAGLGALGWARQHASRSEGNLVSLDDAPPAATGSLMSDNRKVGHSLTGSQRMTLGPLSFVDVPHVVAQPEIASMHGDTHSRYEGRSSSSSGFGHRHGRSESSSDKERVAQGGTVAGPSATPFSSNSARPARFEETRKPSLSAIGGGIAGDNARDSGTTNTGTKTDGGSGTGSGTRSSGVPTTPGTDIVATPTEYGEMAGRPISGASRRNPLALRLPGVQESREKTAGLPTPPPPPEAATKVTPLSPPPLESQKPWWRY